jgi:hypothetical protein
LIHNTTENEEGGIRIMTKVIQRIGLIAILCFVLFGCSFLVKELHLSVPPQIVAGTHDPGDYLDIIELDATVSTAYPVPNPYDGTSADLTVQLIASGLGTDNLYLNPGTVVIRQGESVGTFFVSAFYDGTPAADETVTITAKAVGYQEDSATIWISYPTPP